MASTRRKAASTTQHAAEKKPAKKSAAPRVRTAAAPAASTPGDPELAADPSSAQPANVARDEAILRFGGDWSQRVEGSIVTGGRLKVEYDPARAPQRETREGVPAWGVQAYVMFVPGGELIEAPAIEFGRNGETDHPRTRAFTVEIPEGADEVQVWFKNWIASGHADAWDSNFGHNYRFQVSR